MNKIIFIIAILNLLINTSCFLGNSINTKKQPEWINYMYDWKVFYGSKIVSVSHGISKYEATIVGLNLFSQAINGETRVIEVEELGYTAFEEFDSGDFHDPFIVKEITHFSQSFGKILIEGNTERSIKELGTDNTSELMEYFTEYVTVGYNDENKSLSYSLFFNGEGYYDTIIERRLDIYEQNCNIDCLLKELKGIGFHYEFYFDESRVWFFLEKETAYPNVEAEIKKYKKMLESNLIEWWDYNAKLKKLLGI